MNNLWGLFAPKPESSLEKARRWIRELKHQQRLLDRDLRVNEREQRKVKQELKKVVTEKGNKATAVKTYVKSILRSQQHCDRLVRGKIRIDSVIVRIKEVESYARVAGVMKQSVAVLKAMQSVMDANIPVVTKAAHSMSQEMLKAGVISEMLDQAMDQADFMAENDDDELADATVDAILFEVTQGEFGKAGVVPSKKKEQEEEDEDAELEKLKSSVPDLHIL